MTILNNKLKIKLRFFSKSVCFLYIKILNKVKFKYFSINPKNRTIIWCPIFIISPILSAILLYLLFTCLPFLRTFYFYVFQVDSFTLTTLSDPVKMLIGIATVFFLFFGFAQFAISSSKISSDLVRKHILFSQKTYYFLSLQFGIIILFVIFSLLRTTYSLISNFQFLFFLFSLLLSFFYFFWLIEKTSTKGLIKLIIAKFDVGSIKKADQKLLEANNQFQQLVNYKAEGIKYKSYELYDFTLKQDIVISSEDEGYITHIDFEKIKNIVQDYKDEVDEVIFMSFLGDRVPKNDFYPNVKFNQPIIKIRTKLNLHFDNLKITKDYDKLKPKILKCFSFDSNTYFLEGNRDIIKDLAHIVSYSFNANQRDSKELLDEIQGFIVKMDYSFRAKKSKMVNYFLTIFLDDLKSLIIHTSFSQAKFDHTLDIIYSLRNISFSHQYSNLQKKIIETSCLLFEQAILNLSLLNYYEINFLLYIHELTYRYDFVYILKDKSMNEIKEYYEFLYKFGIDAAFQIVVFIIKRYNSSPEDLRFNFLFKNSKYLLDFPKVFIQDNLLESYSFENPGEFEIFKFNLYLYLLEDLFDLLVYLTSESRIKKEYSKIISEIVLPLIIFIDSNFNYSKELTTKLLSNLLIKYGPRFSNNDFLIEKVVMRPAGGYSLLLLDDSTAQIVISLKYFIDTKIFIPTFDSINSNLPEEDKDKRERIFYYSNQKVNLETLLNKLKSADKAYICDLLGISSSNIDDYLKASAEVLKKIENEIKNSAPGNPQKNSYEKT